ncbi:MAG TPA: peptidoglycan-binding domain-containing protein [Micromonosporaceae bacterium]|nr:peptidoglycan-binding domain-containing protein [Micromonosporaceae bacterium]
MSSQQKTVIRRGLAGLAAAAMLTGAFAAGRASVSSAGAVAAGDRDAAAVRSLWTVRNETIGRSLTFNGRIKASTTPGPAASAEGVVTSIAVAAPGNIKAGTQLYSVNLRPVVAGQGLVPGFRDLSQGMRGADVRQLRQFLCGQGWKAVCRGSDRFDRDLSKAVVSWQKRLGVEADGVVRSGDILWFPSLPMRVRPSGTLKLGETATRGDRPFTIEAGAAVLELHVSREQAALVPVGASAVVGGDRSAVVARIAPADGQPEIETERPVTTEAGDTAGGDEFLIELVDDGSKKPLCQVDTFCTNLLGERRSVTTEVVVQTVPERQGPAVPVGAIRTDAGGQTYVRMADGRLAEIVVVAVAGGVAIVNGLAIGDQIMMP